MFGISAAAYPALDIPAIQLDDAKLIYRRDYYDRMDLDLLPPRLALIVFDSAVNSGVGTAVRWLQTCVGTTADGVLGPGTQLAVRAALAKDGLDELCACYLALRLTTLARLAIWPTYGSGWARRVCRLAFQSCGMGVT
jgi:lysozyme family protein